MTVNTAKRQGGGTWRIAAAESVLKEAVTQKFGKFIDKRQATVTEWVALRPVLEVCNRGAGYEGGGRRRDLLWRQTADQKQLKATLEDILEAARERRRESSRHVEGEGGGKVA